jgi:hypothetical protein
LGAVRPRATRRREVTGDGQPNKRRTGVNRHDRRRIPRHHLPGRGTTAGRVRRTGRGVLGRAATSPAASGAPARGQPGSATDHPREHRAAGSTTVAPPGSGRPETTVPACGRALVTRPSSRPRRRGHRTRGGPATVSRCGSIAQVGEAFREKADLVECRAASVAGGRLALKPDPVARRFLVENEHANQLPDPAVERGRADTVTRRSPRGPARTRRTRARAETAHQERAIAQPWHKTVQRK